MPEPSGPDPLAAAQLIPLAAVHAGQEVRLVSVHAGHHMKARLAGMGILPGSRITVIRNSGGGPLLVAVHNTRLAIGRGMVHRMIVTSPAAMPR